MLLKLIFNQRLVMQKEERCSHFMNYHTPFKALYAAIITESYVSSFTIYLSFSSSTLRGASSQTDTDVTRAGRFVCDHVWYLNCDLLCVGGRTCQIQNSVAFSAITLVFKAAVSRNKEWQETVHSSYLTVPEFHLQIEFEPQSPKSYA